MEKNEYRIMHDIEQTYWWFVGKQFLVRRILQQFPLNKTGQDRILDIGCGTGIMLKLLENFGVSYGAECSADAIQFLSDRGLNLIVRSDVDQSVPFKDNTFSAITCLDVLEHLDNDLKLLKEIGRVCKPGGYVILTVPAFGILWSSHDIALHHKRRYTKQQMLSMISQFNWKVIKCSYYNGILFCPILSIRMLKKCLSRHNPARSDFFINLPAWLNRTLCLFFLCEISLLKYLNLPFGVSLLFILQKSDRA